MCNEQFANARTRVLMKNMAYVGVLAALLDLDRAVIDQARRGDVREEAGAARVEHEGSRVGLRVRARQLRLSAAAARQSAEQDGRAHHDRRQHGRGARLRLCRRHGRRVVSHHAVDVVDGCVQGFLRALPQGSANRRAALLHRAGRGRARGDRHRARRHVERRARVHADERPRPLVDDGVPGVRVFHRVAGRAVRRATRGPVDGHAHADSAGRPAGGGVTRRTATRSTCCCFRAIRTSVSSSRSRPSISPSGCRRRSS